MMSTRSFFLIPATLLAFSLTNCMKKPIACVDSETKTAKAGQSIAFDASCSMDAHHYEWEFGDGSTGNGAQVNHAYNSTGSYTAKVKAMSKNMKKESEKTIKVVVN